MNTRASKGASAVYETCQKLALRDDLSSLSVGEPDLPEMVPAAEQRRGRDPALGHNTRRAESINARLHGINNALALTAAHNSAKRWLVKRK